MELKMVEPKQRNQGKEERERAKNGGGSRAAEL